MRDNPIAQWAVQGISVLAFLILITYLSGFLPDEGFLGAVKRVVAKH